MRNLNKLENFVSEIRQASSVFKPKRFKTKILKEDDKQNSINDDEFIDIDEDMDPTNDPSENNNAVLDNYIEILPSRFTPSRDYLGYENIIEIAFRWKEYKRKSMLDLIRLFYLEFNNPNTKISIDEMMLLRVLAVYNSFDLLQYTLKFLWELK